MQHLAANASDLDRIHWLDRVGVKRAEAEAIAMVAALAEKPCWIIEGVYGWLLKRRFPARPR